MCDDDDLQRYTQQHLRQKCGYINMALMEFPFFAPAPLDRTHCMNNHLYHLQFWQVRVEKKNREKKHATFQSYSILPYLSVSKSVRNFSSSVFFCFLFCGPLFQVGRLDRQTYRQAPPI